MATVSLTLKVDGMSDFRERLNERIAAFTTAAEELSAMIPGELEIEMKIVGFRSHDGILDWMKEHGLGVRVQKDGPIDPEFDAHVESLLPTVEEPRKVVKKKGIHHPDNY